MNCNFDKPDCLNCPYPECIATIDDIKRQWRHDRKYKRRDSADTVPTMTRSSVKPIYIGTSYTEGVKRRQKRYNQTEKGRENQRKKTQRKIESGKNAEYCRRYYERRKDEVI